MLKLDHVVLPVRDAQKTLDFYRGLLGLPLVDALSGDDWDSYPWLMMIFGLRGGQELVAVALQGAPAPDYRGVPMDARHYAFAAASAAELDDWRGKLREAGVDYWEERHGEQSSLYFPDPDGVILEITWPASAATPNERPDAIAAAERWINRARVPA